MSIRTNGGFQTEVEFTLPKGYLDEHGVLHRRGVMRLATAADEILPLRDPRVQQNQAYLAVIVLARVITKLGDVPEHRHASHRRAVRLRPRLPAAALRADQRRGDRRAARRRAMAPTRRGFADRGGSLKASPAQQLREEMAFIAYHFHWGPDVLLTLEHARAAALVPRDLADQPGARRRAAEPVRRTVRAESWRARPSIRFTASGSASSSTRCSTAASRGEGPGARDEDRKPPRGRRERLRAQARDVDDLSEPGARAGPGRRLPLGVARRRRRGHGRSGER